MCSVAAGALLVGSAMLKGYADSSSADDEAAAATLSARAARARGESAMQVSRFRATEVQRDVEDVVGKQRVAQVGAGLAADSPVVGQVAGTSYSNARMKQLAIMLEGRQAAWESEVDARNFERQASAARRKSMLAPFAAVLPAAAQGVTMYSAGSGKA